MYGYHAVPLGEILLAETERGVCWMGPVPMQDRAAAFEKMKKHWPEASFFESTDENSKHAAHIFRIWRGAAMQKKVTA